MYYHITSTSTSKMQEKRVCAADNCALINHKHGILNFKCINSIFDAWSNIMWKFLFTIILHCHVLFTCSNGSVWCFSRFLFVFWHLHMTHFHMIGGRNDNRKYYFLCARNFFSNFFLLRFAFVSVNILFDPMTISS